MSPRTALFRVYLWRHNSRSKTIYPRFHFRCNRHGGTNYFRYRIVHWLVVTISLRRMQELHLRWF